MASVTALRTKGRCPGCNKFTKIKGSKLFCVTCHHKNKVRMVQEPNHHLRSNDEITPAIPLCQFIAEKNNGEPQRTTCISNNNVTKKRKIDTNESENSNDIRNTVPLSPNVQPTILTDREQIENLLSLDFSGGVVVSEEDDKYTTSVMSDGEEDNESMRYIHTQSSHANNNLLQADRKSTTQTCAIQHETSIAQNCTEHSIPINHGYGTRRAVRQLNLNSEERNDNNESGELSIDESDADIFSSDSSGENNDSTPIGVYCHNCMRQDVAFTPEDMDCTTWNEKHHGLLDSIYQSLDIKRIQLQAGSFKRKLCAMNLDDYKVKAKVYRPVPLCRNCAIYLTVKGDDSKKLQHGWPSQIWKLMSNEELLELHGSNLWKLIPQLWRKWWVKTAQKFIHAMDHITISEPRAIVRDGTPHCERMRRMDKELTIKELHNAWDDHSLPCVKCPWGCVEQYHRVGSVPFDTVLAKLFSVESLLLSQVNKLKKVVGIRNNFLYFEQERDFLLGMPDCEVMATIGFSHRAHGLCCYTCSNHDGGSDLHYIHPPKNPFGYLPSDISDQYSPVVLVPRRIKHMKHSEYTNTYQTDVMRGEYGGVGTMTLTQNGKFDKTGYIPTRYQALAIAGRHDIKTHVSRLASENTTLPSYIGKKMLEESEEFIPDITEYDSYCSGATYVPFKSAVDMYTEFRGSKTPTLIVPENYNEESADDNSDISSASDESNINEDGVIFNRIKFSNFNPPSEYDEDSDFDDFLDFDMQPDDDVLFGFEDETSKDSDSEINEGIERHSDQDVSMAPSIHNPYIGNSNQSSNGVPVKNVPYQPSWPTSLNIIQVADTYGVCPPDAPNFNNASNICYNLLFYMVTCHALIDEIWEETQLCNYSYNQWNGFLLHYTTQYCLRPFRNNCGRRVHRSSPYYKFANKLKKHQQEHELVGYFQVETIDGRHDYSYNYAELVHAFTEHTNIRIVQPEYNADYLDFPDLVDDNVHTLIFINTVPATKRTFFSDEQMKHVHPNTYSDRNGCIWELRLLGASKTSTGDRHRNTNWQRTICFRYGGQLHTNWWKISGSQTRFLKASGDSPSYDQLESWDILVYVKTEHGDTSGLKQQFLEALGGQLSWKCNKHNVLLVDTPHHRAVTPHCCCSRDLSITCDDSLLSTPEVNYCARKVKYCCT